MTEPIEIAFRFQDLPRGQFARCTICPPGEDGFPRHRPRQYQFVARSREAHVEQARLFTECFPLLPPSGQPVRQARVKLRRVGRFDFRTQAEFLVQNHAVLQIVEVEPLPQVGDNHHRKLEPFALMNAHQLDSVFRRDDRRLRLHLRFQLRLDERQEAEQALPLELVELPRHRQQPLHVGPPLRPAGLRQQPGLIVRFRKHGFQAVRQTTLPRQLSPGGKAFQKLCNLLAGGPGEKSRTQHHAKPPGTAAGGW